MFAKLYKSITVLLLIVVLSSLALTSASAVAFTGTGPDDAMTPGGDWMPIARGETHWFAFKYDKHGNDANSTSPSTIKIRMYGEPTNGAIFRVITPQQADEWRRTGEIKWIGSGAKNEAEKGDLFWKGAFPVSGTYYVIVQHSKQGTQPTWCKLSISGDGVSF